MRKLRRSILRQGRKNKHLKEIWASAQRSLYGKAYAAITNVGRAKGKRVSYTTK